MKQTSKYQKYPAKIQQGRKHAEHFWVEVFKWSNKSKAEIVRNKALRKIKLPKNPTQKDIVKYLQKMNFVSQGQRNYSDSNLQVSMIQKIPSTFVSVVANFTGLRLHIDYALPAMIKKEHKNIAINALLLHHNLIKPIVFHGWVDDAWSNLLFGLKNKRSLPEEWIKIVLQKNREDGNKALIIYASRNITPDLLDIFKYSNLNKEELKKAVLKNWRIKKYSNKWESGTAALCAVQYGNMDALKHLMFFFRSTKGEYFDYLKEQAVSILSQVLDYKGNLKKWYEKNKDKLIFDEKIKKFVVKK